MSVDVSGELAAEYIIETSRLGAVALFGAVIGMRSLTELVLSHLCGDPKLTTSVVLTTASEANCLYVRGTANYIIIRLAVLSVVFFAVGVALPWWLECDSS